MKKHLATTVKYILREDGSSFHRYIFDYDTGKPLYRATAQGASYDMDCDGLILRGKIRRITKVFGCSKSAILPHLLFLKFFIK